MVSSLVRSFMSGEGLAASSGYRLPDEVPAMLGRRLDATLDAEAERFSRCLHQFLGTRDPDLHPESLATFVDAVLTDALGKRYTKKP